MDWRNLETFLALYHHETYAAAGRELGVSTTTVSRRIDRLSESVGAALFQSTAEGLVPTPAAERILPHAVNMGRQAGLIAREMNGDASSLSGLVRISTTAEFLTYFLVDHLPTLRANHPKMELEFVISDGLVTLGAGDADLAVRFAKNDAGIPLSRAESPDAVVGRLLGPVAVATVASSDYVEQRNPRPEKNFDDQDLILPTGASHIPGMENLRSRGEQSHIAFRCDSIAALTEAAASGFGITATPWFMVPRFPSLEVLEVNVDLRSAWLLTARDLRRNARVRAVHDFLVELWVRWGGFLAGDETAIPTREEN